MQLVEPFVSFLERSCFAYNVVYLDFAGCDQVKACRVFCCTRIRTNDPEFLEYCLADRKIEFRRYVPNQNGSSVFTQAVKAQMCIRDRE